MQGEARQDERDECLDRFDDFQKCVLVSTRLPPALRQNTENRLTALDSGGRA